MRHSLLVAVFVIGGLLAPISYANEPAAEETPAVENAEADAQAVTAPTDHPAGKKGKHPHPHPHKKGGKGKNTTKNATPTEG